MFHDFYQTGWFIILFDILFCFGFVLNIFYCLDNIGIKYEKKTKRIILCHLIPGVVLIQFFWFMHSFYFWRD
jgi:hypothetical protein